MSCGAEWFADDRRCDRAPRCACTCSAHLSGPRHTYLPAALPGLTPTVSHPRTTFLQARQSFRPVRHVCPSERSRHHARAPRRPSASAACRSAAAPLMTSGGQAPALDRARAGPGFLTEYRTRICPERLPAHPPARRRIRTPAALVRAFRARRCRLRDGTSRWQASRCYLVSAPRAQSISRLDQAAQGSGPGPATPVVASAQSAEQRSRAHFMACPRAQRRAASLLASAAAAWAP
jgi:hypothetical protein